MIHVKKNPLLQEFFGDVGLHLDPQLEFTLKNYVQGLLVNGNPSIKNIAENTVLGQSERQMNRAIHKLSSQSDEILKENFTRLQKISGLSVKAYGVIALDEHIIEKTGKHIEGVDYFHTSSGEKYTLGLSMISTHYYGGKTEYPIERLIYRRESELEKWGKQDLYRPKNELARELIRNYAECALPCKTWVMDAYFMTKENVKELKAHGFSYVSKIKRNWNITYQKTHWSVSDLYGSLSESEFHLKKVINTKTREVRIFRIAFRDVFIKKIGNTRLVFLRELEKDKSGNLVEKYPDKWMCLATNLLDMSPAKIVQTYMKRWTIETSYRDENQNLHLDGCMWRNIEGQYCFISLVFLAYRFLVWADHFGFLSEYGPSSKTLGKKQEAYKKFSDEIFGEWITELKQRCEHCQAARVVYQLIHGIKFPQI